MVDIVFGEIELPPGDLDWRSAMRRRAISTREALKRHSWAIGMMESRHPGPANLRNHNAVMGCLRKAGFSFEMAVHAYSVQDAYIYGFALQERDLGSRPPTAPEKPRSGGRRRSARSTNYPYLVEIARRSSPSPGTTTPSEFAWGLDLILDGLEQLRHAGGGPPLPGSRVTDLGRGGRLTPPPVGAASPRGRPGATGSTRVGGRAFASWDRLARCGGRSNLRSLRSQPCPHTVSLSSWAAMTPPISHAPRSLVGRAKRQSSTRCETSARRAKPDTVSPLLRPSHITVEALLGALAQSPRAGT
jgi:hypothetical protein